MNRQPFVALESTVIAHGLPHPHNLALARRLEAVILEEGGLPRTVGVLQGRPLAGLMPAQIEHLATHPGVRKLSLRDLPVAVARRQDGATTVAATMWIAHRHGIEVFATGGIGGVHRAVRGGPSFDVSADLDALARIPMVVVCAGAKAILDLPATREVLETRGVTVVGYGTDEMPAFYSRTSGLPVDVRCDTPEEVAALVRARRDLGLPGATLVTVPIPEEAAIPAGEIAPAIEQALEEADRRGLRSGEVTPFLLQRLSTLTGERSLRANLALLEHNARVAARIAVALAPPRYA
ncbi:pseudouridine-5-phosphate glycosidase [Rhodothermaceae bacterium RA]|nr:pseudouridine-5-phosphate glycosidase [Rhodothermaceae bacterium RA]